MRAQRARAAAWVSLVLLSGAALAEGLRTSSSSTNLRANFALRTRVARPSKAFWTLNVNADRGSRGEVLQQGEALSVVGSLEELGGWDVDSAVPLHEGVDGTWTVSLQLPAGQATRYKYLVSKDSRCEDAIEGERQITLSAHKHVHVREVFNAHGPRALIAPLFSSKRGAGGGGGKVRFCVVVCGLKEGESVLLCGEPAALGGWEPDLALPMQKASGDAANQEWVLEVDVPLDQIAHETQYKYLIQASHEWEMVDNRQLHPASLSGPFPRQEFFNHLPDGPPGTPPPPPPSTDSAAGAGGRGGGKDDTVLCKFKVELGWGFQGSRLGEGDAVCIVGGTGLLGNWNVNRAVPLLRLEGNGDQWGTSLRLPHRDVDGVEYKYALFRAPRWEFPEMDTHRQVTAIAGGTTFLKDVFGHLLPPDGAKAPVAVELPEVGPEVARGSRRTCGRVVLEVDSDTLLTGMDETLQVGVVGVGGGLSGWDLNTAFPMDKEQGPDGRGVWAAALEGHVGEEVRYKYVVMTPPRWEGTNVDRTLYTGPAGKKYLIQEDTLGVWDGSTPPEGIEGAPNITTMMNAEGFPEHDYDEDGGEDFTESYHSYDEAPTQPEHWEEEEEEWRRTSHGLISPDESARDHAQKLALTVLRERWKDRDAQKTAAGRALGAVGHRDDFDDFSEAGEFASSMSGIGSPIGGAASPCRTPGGKGTRILQSALGYLVQEKSLQEKLAEVQKTPEEDVKRVRTTRVVLRTTRRLKEGECPYLLGAHAAMDAWNPDGGVEMRPVLEEKTEQDWFTVVKMTQGESSEFKFVLRGPNKSTRWEDGKNHYMQVGVGVEDSESVVRETLRLPEIPQNGAAPRHSTHEAPKNGETRHETPLSGHGKEPSMSNKEPAMSSWAAKGLRSAQSVEQHRAIDGSDSEESSSGPMHVVISSVERDSPAWFSGLQQGDRLLSVGRVDLSRGATNRSSEEIASEIRSLAGRELVVKVIRPGGTDPELMKVHLNHGASPLGCTLALSAPIPA